MEDDDDGDDADGVERDEEKGGPGGEKRDGSQSSKDESRAIVEKEPHHRFFPPRVAIGIPVRIKIDPATPYAPSSLMR